MEMDGIQKLELAGVIGFNGSVPAGLKVHPNRGHIVFVLGSTVIIEDLNDKKQSFLQGHTNNVTCIAISRDGNYIASGQMTHMGFKADIIVWDFHTQQVYAKFVLHKVKVQSVAFSPNGKYLVSLGGQDDGSVVVWSLAKKEPICGSPAQVMSAGITECLICSNNDDNLFVTAGDGTLRVWELDVENRKIRPTEVMMGQLKRTIKCLELSEDDSQLYCGTTSGDVLGINMVSRLFQNIGPEKDKYQMGVSALALLKSGEILVGAGDGTVGIMKQTVKEEGKKKFLRFVRTKKEQKLDSGVTSISLRGAGHQFYAASAKSQIYRFNFTEFSYELITTCHYSAINDVTFPTLVQTVDETLPRVIGTSDLFATCSHQDVRVWHSPTLKELLRINVTNMTCYSADFLKDGSAIVTGWDDSRIRGFYPETGRLMFAIDDAHCKGVTAVATTSDCRRIVSGGGEGQVRVWQLDVRPQMSGRGSKMKMTYTVTTSLVEAMKEHNNAVSSIRISKNDSQCVSSSADGTCIVWDLGTFRRKQIIFANTLFRCVCYNHDESQIIASGTDRKIGYWDLYDGSIIREVEGSRTGSLNGMDISQDGHCFVTAGDDKLVKVWKYDEGEVTHVGIGHSSPVTRVRICPNSRLIVTLSEDGAIYLWKYPSLA